MFKLTFELDLISLLVNFSCELGKIMTRYDFLWAEWFWAMFGPTWTWPNFPMVNFSCELDRLESWLNLLFGQLVMWSWANDFISRFDFLWARWVTLSNVQTTWTWHNFTFGQFFMLIGANNDQIWLPVTWIFNWFWAMFETTWTWLISIFGDFSCALIGSNNFLWVILSNVKTDLNST